MYIVSTTVATGGLKMIICPKLWTKNVNKLTFEVTFFQGKLQSTLGKSNCTTVIVIQI